MPQADAQQHPNILEEPDQIYESMHDPEYDTYVALLNSDQWDDIYVSMNVGDEDIYTAMPEEEADDIYQNTQDMIMLCCP